MSTSVGPRDSGKLVLDAVSKRYRRRGVGTRRTGDDVWALRDVSLEVEPGEMLGLVGVNGSGKSTLLRLASGVTAPSQGTVLTEGRVAGILSLGDGFHTLLTGRENALTAAILSGMSRSAANARLGAIIDFSELGRAIDDPVRTYSAGMFVRLAYAVAAHVDADILLVDEALAVGDLAFATKCLDHLDALRDRGTTILLASHDLGVVRRTCDQVAWIHGGCLRAIGPPDETTDAYERASHVTTRRLTPGHRIDAGRLGTGEVEILGVEIRTDGRSESTVVAGRSFEVELTLVSHVGHVGSVITMSIHDRRGDILVDIAHPVMLDAQEAPLTVTVTLDRLDLAAGEYCVAVGAHAPEFVHAHDYLWEAATFSVTGSTSNAALLPPHRWTAR